MAHGINCSRWCEMIITKTEKQERTIEPFEPFVYRLSLLIYDKFGVTTPASPLEGDSFRNGTTGKASRYVAEGVDYEGGQHIPVDQTFVSFPSRPMTPIA